MCRQQPINPRDVYTCVMIESLTQHLQPFQAIRIRVVLSTPNSVGLCTTTNWIARVCHSRSWEDTTLQFVKASKLQVWNSIRRGTYYSCFDKQAHLQDYERARSGWQMFFGVL